MIGAAAEAAGIARDPHHPLPDHRARPLGRLRPAGRGPLRPPLLLLGELQARSPPGAGLPHRGPRGARGQGGLGRAGPRGHPGRGRLARPGPARGGPLHRRPPRRPCARSSSCCLTASGDRAAPRPRGAHGERGRPHPQPRRPRRARLAPACSRPLGPGRAPSSEVAHWAILGYRAVRVPRPRRPRGPRTRPFTGRRRGARPRGPPHHRAARRRHLGDRPRRSRRRRGRPGPAGEHPAARRSAGSRMELRPLVPERGEGVLVVTGGAHDAVTDSDPFFRDRLPMLRPRPLVPEAAATARAAELWSRATLRALERHPVNAARRRRDRPPLDAVTLKWWGRPREAPSFRARHGLDGVLIAASPFLAGLAATMGLRFVPCAEGDDPAAALRERLAPGPDGPRRGRHLRLLPPQGDRRGRPHQGPGREATHDRGRRCGARAASATASPTRSSASPATTPRRPRPRSSTPGIRCRSCWPGPASAPTGSSASGSSTAPRACSAASRAPDVMPVLLNAADRPLFLGSRPTPVPSPPAIPGRRRAPAALDGQRRPRLRLSAIIARWISVVPAGMRRLRATR